MIVCVLSINVKLNSSFMSAIIIIIIVINMYNGIHFHLTGAIRLNAGASCPCPSIPPQKNSWHWVEILDEV